MSVIYESMLLRYLKLYIDRGAIVYVKKDRVKARIL